MNTSALMVVRNSTFCDTIYDSFIPFSWASLENSQKQVLPPVPHGDTSQACTVRVPGLYPGSWQRWFRTRCRGRPEALDAAIQLLSRIGVDTNSELQGEVGNPVAALRLLFPWTWTQKCWGEICCFAPGPGRGPRCLGLPAPKEKMVRTMKRSTVNNGAASFRLKSRFAPCQGVWRLGEHGSAGDGCVASC